MTKRRWVALASSLALAVSACAVPMVPQGRSGSAMTNPAHPLTGLIVLSDRSQLPLKQAFRTKGVSFSDPSVAYLRLTAAGTDFAPVTQDYPWVPGTAFPTISLAVPAGKNRVITLSALNAQKLVLTSLKGVATVAASGTTSVTIDWATTPTATVLENLAISNPTLVSQVDVAQLQALVNTISGYEPATGSFTQSPAQIDAGAIAADVVTKAGSVPANDPGYFSALVGSVNVNVIDSSSNPVATGVRLQINDLLSAPVASTVANPTAVASVALGRWQVSASHATLGTGTTVFEITQTAMTPTITVTLGTPAVVPTGDTGTVTTLFQGQRTAVDGTATTAAFVQPAGVAVVGTTAYVTERSSIRVVNLTTGAVTTLAGNGVYGDVDGTGAAARFKKLAGIAASHSGTYLYVADSDANKIKRVTIATGQVTTIAGSGAIGYVNATGTSAAFHGPVSVAIGPNDDYLVVSDIWNHRLRHITLPGGVVTELVKNGSYGTTTDGGPGTAETSVPSAVAIDPAGHYAYFCDFSQRLRKVVLDPGVGTVGTVSAVTTGGNGYAEGAAGVAAFAWDDDQSHMDWGRQTGLAFSPDGSTLYVSDTRNNRIRQIDVATGTTSLLAGSGKASLIDDTGAAAAMAHPAGLSVDGGGNLVFVDFANYRLRRLNVTTGATSFVAGSGATAFAEGTLGSGGYYAEGGGLAYDPSRNRLYVLDRITNRVLAYDPASNALTNLAGSGERGTTDGPAATASFTFNRRNSGCVYDAVRDCLYVTHEDRIRKLDLTGPVTVSTLTSGVYPYGLAIDDSASFLYSGANGVIDKIDLNNGTVVQAVGSGTNFGRANGLAVKGNDLYVTSSLNGGHFWKVDLTTDAVSILAGTGTHGIQDGTGTAAQVGYVLGMAVDPSQAYVYMADYWYFDPVYAIRRLKLSDNTVSSLMRRAWDTTDGSLAVAATAGGAKAIAFDSANSTMYFLDMGSYSLRKLVFQ